VRVAPVTRDDREGDERGDGDDGGEKAPESASTDSTVRKRSGHGSRTPFARGARRPSGNGRTVEFPVSDAGRIECVGQDRMRRNELRTRKLEKCCVSNDGNVVVAAHEIDYERRIAGPSIPVSHADVATEAGARPRRRRRVGAYECREGMRGQRAIRSRTNACTRASSFQ